MDFRYSTGVRGIVMEVFSPGKFSVNVLEEGSRGPTVENKWHGFPLDSALSRSIH